VRAVRREQAVGHERRDGLVGRTVQQQDRSATATPARVVLRQLRDDLGRQRAADQELSCGEPGERAQDLLEATRLQHSFPAAGRWGEQLPDAYGPIDRGQAGQPHHEIALTRGAGDVHRQQVEVGRCSHPHHSA
jgi:hypothetical protein